MKRKSGWKTIISPRILLLGLLATPLCGQQFEQVLEAAQQAVQELSSNAIINDTITLADAGGLVQHEITAFGSCHFFAKRGRRWYASFADGSSIELTCDPDTGHFLPGFHLWYKSTQGKRLEIGRCIFDSGLNRGWYYTSGDPGALKRVVWQNVDGGKNDGGGRHIDREHLTGLEEPYLDVVRWIFNSDSNSLETVADKYEYAVAPPGLPSDPKVSIAPYVGPLVGGLRQSFVKDFAY